MADRADLKSRIIQLHNIGKQVIIPPIFSIPNGEDGTGVPVEKWIEVTSSTQWVDLPSSHNAAGY